MINITDILWPEHRRRCDAVIRDFREGTINGVRAAIKLRRLGYEESEVQAELMEHYFPVRSA